jgi:uncharacterized membrane protein
MSASLLSISRPHERKTPLELVHSDLSCRNLSWRERVALGAICLCTLVLLTALQYGRVFTGDEVGTLRYLKESPSFILTHFTTHLSMNYFILVEKGVAWLSGAADWRLTLLPMAAALAIIPLTASLALKFTGSTRTALTAASLAAFNPYLVSWGAAIRAYSLLVAFSLLTINEFFHWYRQRDWWSGARCAAVVLLLLLTHLNGIYTVVFIVLLLAVEATCAGWFGRSFLWESRTLWIPLAGAAVLLGVAYWRLLPEIAQDTRKWAFDTPLTSMGYLPPMFTTYMGIGYTVWLSVPLLLAGCWSAAREKRAVLLLCGAIVLGPILMSLQGVSVDSGAAARYLIFSLPLLLILMSEGIDWLANHVRIRANAAIAAWGLTALAVVCWTPYIRAQFLAKKWWPYARVAKFLHGQMQKNDVIVAGWSIGFTLSQFFDHSKDRIMLPNKYVNTVSTQLDAPLLGRVFYVTGPSVLYGRKASIRDFERLEVTTYSGHTARELLQRWREDLLLRTEARVVARELLEQRRENWLRRTEGRVAPPCQNDYQLLALLEESLPSGHSADHWRSLAERCSAQPLSEYVPQHALKAIRSVRFP